MGPDLELKGRPTEIMMESLNNKESETKNLQCASNYEDNTFEIDTMYDQMEEPQRVDDVDVNIIDCTNSGETKFVQDEYQDATESSSSFSNSGSGIDNGGALSDAEVMSDLRGDDKSAFGFGDLFRTRKKKVTSHWRTFIQPLMWRCKWMELQIKNFQSQARKYDTKITATNRRKQSDVANLKLESSGARSLPYCNNHQREKVMQRKKRKLVEDTMDTAAYTSQHNLFSYYENRKRSITDAVSMDNDVGNQAIPTDNRINGNNEFAVNDELSALGFRDGDDSMERILWKIGVAQSQVIAMKTRLDKVTSENAAKFSSIDKLSSLVPCNDLNVSAQNLAQLKPEFNMGEPVIPGSAVSSHGEVSHLLDTSDRSDQHHISGGVSENSEDGILIYNKRAKEEVDNFEVKIKPTQTVQLPKQEPETTDSRVDLLTDDQSTPKIRSISKITAPKIKRKRGRRKAGSGRWSRRTSG